MNQRISATCACRISLSSLVWTLLWFGGLATGVLVQGQDNYEIQVYGSETVAAGATMVELHSNYTIDGVRPTADGTLPSYHAFHETLEVTRGFTPWFEVGAYVFSSVQPGRGWEWVGDHIRPRVRVPEGWKWPVGVSLSTEFGYARPSFTRDTSTWELRPILDKQVGGWYFALNPALEKSLHGPSSRRNWEFAPSGKVSYEIIKHAALGLEYYGALGEITHFDALPVQQHQVMPVLDLDLGSKWEFNFGVGVGLTGSTDGLITKLILGRRF